MKKIIVIKIGSTVLMTKRNQLDELHIAHIAQQVSVLKKKGIGVVLVISGAVAYGSNFIDLAQNQSLTRQAAAGIGQVYTTCTFNNIFTKSKLQLAQVLLTKDYLATRAQKEKIKRLIEFYIKSDFIPFINENDAIDLNSFGGNDHLAAEITRLLHKKKLIILSTWEKSVHGVGGGQAKQDAINMLTEKNIDAIIVNGKTKNIILDSLS